MIVSRLILKNWRNFRFVDVPLGERAFVVGANASGKSNLLDVFRFLRDIAKQQGGGLQKAIQERGGLSKIRSLAARKFPDVEIEVHLSDSETASAPKWKYAIGIRQEARGRRQPYLAFEKVWKGDELILNRPDAQDKQDSERLKQTHLEQINANAAFREIARFFEAVVYIHLVPQLLKFPDAFVGGIEGDPFGKEFLRRVALAPKKIRDARLRKIEEGLRIAVPQLKNLTFVLDEMGKPHLQAIYEHWRAQDAKQREDQFSDGTLRLVALLWALLESDSLLLLEEPELSLNVGVIRQLAGVIHRAQRLKKRQVIVSTHSAELLGEGVGGDEIVLLTTTAEGTEATLASRHDDVRAMLESGFSVGEVVMPKITPPNVADLSCALK